MIRAVDLFCGAGGLSTGLALACEELDEDVDLVAVNHWGKAIETHKQNHPWADHYNAKVEELQPRAVVGGDVDVLCGGPECTHFSGARGGKPVDEQKRASPWHVLDWVSKLLPQYVLVENVPEFESWGPVIDGQPTRNGTFFEAWSETLNNIGYEVATQTLNAADYGDATTRKRLFIIARRGDMRPAFPQPTHAEDPRVDGRDPWRPAAEVIDWADRGDSIWTRSRPLVNNTMQRIAEGIRRFGDEQFAPYADALAELTKECVERMQEDAVAAEDVEAAAEAREDPFLVRGPAVVADGGRAEADQSAGLCFPYVLGQHGGSVPRDAQESPLQTIATRGAVQLIEPESFVLPRNGYHRGLHSNPGYDPDDQPMHTITAKNQDGHLVTPYLVTYNGQSGAEDIREPVPTVTTNDRFALVVPECYPWGLDVRYRMLQPRELARAQGFPDGYEFAGNKTETTEQIGNAIPVNLARSLCRSLLSNGQPTLGSYGGDGGASA